MIEIVLVDESLRSPCLSVPPFILREFSRSPQIDYRFGGARMAVVACSSHKLCGHIIPNTTITDRKNEIEPFK